MCYVREYLITSLNSDLRRRLRIKMSLKWWVLSYIMWTSFFLLQRENQFIRIHSDLGKDHLTMLKNSSRSHHPKNVISRKLSLSSRLGAVIVTDTVRSIKSWWHQYGSCAPLHIHFCMLSLIVRFFEDTLLRFFFYFTSKTFSLTLLLRKLESFKFFSKLITQGDVSFIHLLI